MPSCESLQITLSEAFYSLRLLGRHRPDLIPDADMATIFGAAAEARNGRNAQLWNFLGAIDDGIRAEFAPLYKEAWWANRHDRHAARISRRTGA